MCHNIITRHYINYVCKHFHLMCGQTPVSQELLNLLFETIFIRAGVFSVGQFFNWQQLQDIIDALCTT